MPSGAEAVVRASGRASRGHAPRRRIPWALTAALLAALLLAAGCIEEPPAPPAVEAGSATPAPVATTGEPLRAETIERLAREVTLRVRNLGCGGLATGSAVAIGSDLLVTNRHVIEGADRLEVTTWDGHTLTVGVAKAATTHDIAVAEVDGGLPDAAAVAAADVEAGADVLVAGYPRGGALSIAEGRVTRRTEDLLFGAEAGALALDVEVRPGNSGGPVLDAEGRLVGIVYAYAEGDGRGFAVPVSALRDALEAGEALVDVPDCPPGT